MSSDRQHRVQGGETLSAIAAARLGSASRWPEIYQANKARMDAAFASSGLHPSQKHRIRHPADYLRVGQVLILPQ